MFLDLQNEENVGEDTSDDESINEEVERGGGGSH